MNSAKVVFSVVALATISLIIYSCAPTWKNVLSVSFRIRPVRVKMYFSAHPDQRSNTSDMGYVLATHYSDQLTGSTLNVISLQCWASTLPGKIRVVEPFLHYGSVLGFNLNPYPDNIKHTKHASPQYNEEQELENTVKVSDVFDVIQWSNFISAQRFAPFISWSYFIQHAPRQLIIVDQICDGAPSMCMKCAHDVSFESNLFLKFAERFAEFYNFHLVRKVCYQRKLYSQKEFQDLVYGPYDPQDSVIVFNHFGGMEKNGNRFRTRVDLNRCVRRNLSAPVISTSLHILRVSANYIERYMPHARVSGYVGVLVRMEFIAMAHKFSKMSKKQQNISMNECFEQIVSEVATIKRRNYISEVFIGTDIGKYGSMNLRKSSNLIDYELLLAGLDRMYKRLLGSANRESMMARIDAVVPIQSPGYVALLEKNIAANASCLVLAGGGSFQGSVKHLYNRQHKETNRNCGVREIKC